MIINLKKLNPLAIVPTQAYPDDAGYDLYSLEDKELYPLERYLFKTGISISVPRGHYARIAPRSGLALKNGLFVNGGVCNSGFLGEIGVILVNINRDDDEAQHISNRISIKKHQKIAQLIIEKCYYVEWDVVDNLECTARADGGFGSSGA
jgi:dUTP pyrophosphatase